MTTPIKVLISGGGIAGTCLAFWLSKTRVPMSITVLERAPAPRVTGQSLDIEGPAIEIVRKMQLEAAIRARHTTEEGTRFINSAGKTTVKFRKGEIFTSDYEILRADLVELLMGATKDAENVKYMYGDHVTSVHQTTEKAEVGFASGSKDTFDLIVGADGASSKIRSLTMDEHTLKDSQKFLGQYAAFFSIPSLPTDDKVWEWYSAPKGLSVMTRPHRTPKTRGAYLTITTPAHGQRDAKVEAALDKGTEAAKAMLHEYFDDQGWQSKRVLAAMDQSQDFYMSRLALVRLPKWTSGRSVLVGDAAFATFGIGTTLAIMSGYYLAGELSKIGTSADIADALERYERVFRPVYTKMVEVFPGFPQLGFPQTELGIRTRDFILWVISKTKLYKLFQEASGDEGSSTLPDYDWKGL